MKTFGHTNSSLVTLLSFFSNALLMRKFLNQAIVCQYFTLDYKSVSDVSTCCLTGTNDLYNLQGRIAI